MIPAFARPDRRGEADEEGRDTQSHHPLEPTPTPTGTTGRTHRDVTGNRAQASRSGATRPPWWSAAATIRANPRRCPVWSWAWPPSTSRAPGSGRTPRWLFRASTTGATQPITWPGTGPTPTPNPRTSSCLPAPSATSWSSTTRSTNWATRGLRGHGARRRRLVLPGHARVLITATKDFRDGTIDEETHRARLAERWKHAILPKERPRRRGPPPGAVPGLQTRTRWSAAS